MSVTTDSAQPPQRSDAGSAAQERPPDLSTEQQQWEEKKSQALYRQYRLQEPELRVWNIQGNILPGFNKDHQAFLFFKIVDGDVGLGNVRSWIRHMIPFISTTEQVLAFNRLYKQLNDIEKVDERFREKKPKTIQATWMNIAFSHPALRMLTGDADAFKDRAFVEGLATRSPELGDPRGEGVDGTPSKWKVGGPNEEADIVLIVASDDEADLDKQIDWIQRSISPPEGEDRVFAGEAVKLIFMQRTDVLPGNLQKSEHFGFRDGISQPGVRGQLPRYRSNTRERAESPSRVAARYRAPDPESTVDYLSPSLNEDFAQGKAGQDLVWPGEFVFGYPGQKGATSLDIVEPTDENVMDGPAWAKDGSYLVIRRLRQDVKAFHDFFEKTATELSQAGHQDVSATALEAACVGRWPSGAPVITVQEDGHGHGAAHNGKPEPAKMAPNVDIGVEQDPSNDFEFAEHDPNGTACPFAAHIRLVYSRDDRSTSLADFGEKETSELTTQTHRMLRRGIPFGTPYRRDAEEGQDSGDRGLMFVAYQSSIVDQFEFVTQALVNNPEFRVDNDGVAKTDFDPGYDMIIGQNRFAADRARSIEIYLNQQRVTVPMKPTSTEWVIPTGGGYFFCPSIDALTNHIAT